MILCSRPIGMDQHSIKYVMSPVNKFDAVNKAYPDRIKCETATGNVPNTVMTDHTHFTFPAAKAFASGKIKICEMWVDGWQMMGLRHQVKCQQLSGLTFTSFPEDRPL